MTKYVKVMLTIGLGGRSKVIQNTPRESKGFDEVLSAVLTSPDRCHVLQEQKLGVVYRIPNGASNLVNLKDNTRIERHFQ